MIMKYKILIQISEFLDKFNKISNAKRVGDRILLVEFDKQTKILFDMDKSTSAIYIDENLLQTKNYKAPFDVVLAKRVNSSSLNFIKTLQNNRILHLQTTRQGSYKEIITNLYFEFTGRFTNIIITDENDTIQEALSHYENNIRSIKVGKKLIHLAPFDIKEKDTSKIENMSQFLKDEFKRLNLKNLDDLKNVKLSKIDKKIHSLIQSLNSLQSSQYFLEKSKEFNEKGSLITANLHKLKEFDKDFELINYNGETVKFTIQNTPKFEAQKLFDESKKLKQKAYGVKFEKENLNEKLNFYTSLKELIQNATNINELNVLMPKKNTNKQVNQESENIENFYLNEFKISVGTNEKGNINLLKNSKKDDFWFHLKDIPSAHVIVKTNKQNLNDEIIEFAAKICVNFSVKQSGNYLVDYTKRANVKVKDGAFVNYINYNTISILKP